MTMTAEKQMAADQAAFEPVFEPSDDVDPLELVGNASLALHHHMAPAEGAFELEADDDLVA